MRIEITVPANLATLTALLEGLTIANMWLLRNHSQLPPLYQSGVRYKAEPPGEEKWEIATRVYHTARLYRHDGRLCCYTKGEGVVEGKR